MSLRANLTEISKRLVAWTAPAQAFACLAYVILIFSYCFPLGDANARVSFAKRFPEFFQWSGLVQEWSMFSPSPDIDDTVTVKIIFETGEAKDFIVGDVPLWGWRRYTENGWRRFSTGLIYRPQIRGPFVAYLRRREEAGGGPIRSIELFQTRRVLRAPGVPHGAFYTEKMNVPVFNTRSGRPASKAEPTKER